MATRQIVSTRISFGWIRPAAAWACTLVVGLLLLFGRYDWSSDVQRFALRGYLSSAYMFCIFLPTFYYTLYHFVPHRRVALVATAGLLLVLTLPYHWLGLSHFYYYANDRPKWYLDIPNAQTFGSPDLQPDWFPDALKHLPAIPYEGLLFGGLLLAGLSISAYCWRRVPQPLMLRRNRIIIGLFGMYTLILIQTWLHLSLRSPYTYLPHYERAPSEHYWYHVYLFPDNKGATNADFFAFRAVEEHFMGVPYDVHNLLIRRSFMFYLTSQLSYFINPLYVFLVFNIIAWFAAAICGFLFALPIWGERVAAFAALMIAGGSGFIMYVGQPMNYLLGYAIIIIVPYLFQEFTFNDRGSIYDMVIFGMLLGLCLMIYDIFHVYLFIIGYGLLKKVGVFRILLPIIISVAMYSGFLFIQSNMLNAKFEQSNVKEITEPINTILRLIASHRFDEWYILTMTFFERYFGHMGRVFFVFPILLALFGITFLRNRTNFVIIILMIVPSIATLAYMHFGGTYIALFSRFVYIAYPCIYILASITLDELASVIGEKIHMRLAILGPVICLAMFFVLNNIDVFGFPSLYYHFYHSEAAPWIIAP